MPAYLPSGHVLAYETVVSSSQTGHLESGRHAKHLDLVVLFDHSRVAILATAEHTSRSHEIAHSYPATREPVDQFSLFAVKKSLMTTITNR